MSGLSDLKNFLKICSDLRGRNHGSLKFKYPGGLEDLVLREGLAFSELAAKQPRRRRQGECFKNALELAMSRDDLFYVEGFALAYIPIHHGWCVDAEGKIYEPTWKPEARPYYGVVLDKEFAMKRVIENDHWGLLSNEIHACPRMLNGEFELAAEFYPEGEAK